jgi:putative FmdB family regulatory protein
MRYREVHQVATYAFVCQACGHEFDVNRPMSERGQLDREPPACPACSKTDTRYKPSVFTAIKDWRTT